MTLLLAGCHAGLDVEARLAHPCQALLPRRLRGLALQLVLQVALLLLLARLPLRTHLLGTIASARTEDERELKCA